MPPFLGSKVVKGIALDDIAAYINETALFRNQWQFRPEKKADGKETDDEFKDRLRPILREQLARGQGRRPAHPPVVYGYFAANGDGNDLVIWKDESRDRRAHPLLRSPASKEPYLCIADFFRPIESPEVDYVAFHIVTMGAAVSERTAELFAADKYQDYLLLHGLGVEMAEALAEYWHRRIREEWGFADEDGPDARRPVPPAVPRRPLLVGLPGLPRPRGQREGGRAARRRPHRHRGERGDGLPVPARADHLRHHLPPPEGQVLRRPLGPS